MNLSTRKQSRKEKWVRVYQVIAFFSTEGCLPVGKLHRSQHAAKVEAAKWIGVDYYGANDPFVRTRLHKCYISR